MGVTRILLLTWLRDPRSRVIRHVGRDTSCVSVSCPCTRRVRVSFPDNVLPLVSSAFPRLYRRR